MKTKLQAKETGDPQGGGGTDTIVKPKIGRKIASRATVIDDSDDGGDEPADRSLFNAYNKLRDDGKPKRNSTLFNAMNKAENPPVADDVDDNADDGDDIEPPPTREPKKKKVDVLPTDDNKDVRENDDDLLSLDVSKIQTARGAPISPKAAEAFDRLKKGLQTKNSELEASRKEVEALKVQLTEKGDVDPELTNKYNSLKQEYEAEYFEKTDAFKEAYEKPIEAIKADINGYFDIDPADSQSIGEVTSLFKQASELAASGKKMAFAKILDEIADKHIDGSTSIKSMFSQDMLRWYDAINEYTKIYKSKDDVRKQIIADKLKSRRTEGAGKIITTIDEGLASFKRNKKAVIDNLPDQLKKEYVTEIDEYASSIKDSVADFQLTGALTPKITEVLQRGITSKAIEKELNIAWSAFGDVTNKNKMLQEENADLKSKLSKLTGEPKRDNGVIKRPQPNDNSRGRQPLPRGVSRIADRLRAAGLNDDD